MSIERFTFNVNIETLEESEELLYSDSDIDVVIDYYWDSHGRLVEFNGPNGQQREEIHADTIRIIQINRKTKIGELISDEEIWTAYINGEKLRCMTIEEYRKRKRLFIKAIVGTG